MRQSEGMLELNEYPRLKYFMSCYYHQDWSHDIGSTDEKILWEFFFSEEKLHKDIALEIDIERLMQCDSEKIHGVLSKYQSMGRRWNNAQDAQVWLKKLFEFIKFKNT